MKLLEKPNVISDWRQLLFPLLILLICASIFIQFLKFHEIRVAESGWVWQDPAFSLLPSMDVSIPIFILTYGSVLIYLFYNFKSAERIGWLMITYGYLLLFRMLSMSILPLKEPSDMVFLQDPFLNNFIYPGRINTDLFFSGHCGLLFSMYFLDRKQWYFLLIVGILGIFLMIQRTHYSIDIIGAIPFSFVATVLAKRTSEKIKLPFFR